MRRRRKDIERDSRAARKLLLVLLALFFPVGLYWAVIQPRDVSPQRTADESHSSSSAVPPFHQAEEAAKALPLTLSPALFKQEAVATAYRVAQQIPAVLAQQPCYCRCDRLGHGSLLDCYITSHAAT